jgi:uncharacterized membrane protein YkoI
MKKFLFPPLLVLLLLMSAVVHADIGKKQAVSIAQSVYPGRVLAVKQVQENNVPVYRVKTLSASGDVHIIVIDADSGKVISKQ